MKLYIQYSIYFVCILSFGCDDFVEVDPPRTELVRSSVFDDQTTAEAAVVDLYTSMRNGFASGYSTSISGLTSLSSDELIFYGTSSVEEFEQFNVNNITANNPLIGSLWSNVYSIIYKANAIVEGLSNSNISANIKNQLIGEAKFVRAFCHFYLVNLWGDIPLATTTDYNTNQSLLRTSVSQVYEQIVADLLEAGELLSEDYSYSNGKRVRVNKSTTTAFLSRVYLYMEEWEKSEAEATNVINNELYDLEPDLGLVFRSNSPEVIFQLWYYQYPNDRSTFSIGRRGPALGSLSPDFLANIEDGDQRWAIWGQPRTVNGITYYGVLKYFDFSIPPLDYTTLFRLAEQYLIRAEARTQQNKLADAASDLNVVRIRAGLSNTLATTHEQLLDSIMHERRYELFTEWGHRWFDLKRTGRADEVLSPIKPSWNNEDVLYPIPESQLISNPSMVQNENPG